MTKSSERLGTLVERVRAQSAEFVTRDLDVRSLDQDGIHQMRVATRRLRSALRTFRSAFEPVPARHLAEELKWFSALLGDARDAQVLAERACELGGSVAAERQRTETALVEAMDSPRYRELVVEIATFAISPPFAPDAKGRRWLVRRLRREIERTIDMVVRADELDGPERDLALHEVRKGAKRVRYAAETLEPLFGKKARRIVGAFEAVQSALGEHHDAVVIKAAFLDQEGSGGDGGHGDTAALVAREEEREFEALMKFDMEWSATREMLLRRWPTA
jgi:CHAD domain-containing protein